MFIASPANTMDNKQPGVLEIELGADIQCQLPMGSQGPVRLIFAEVNGNQRKIKLIQADGSLYREPFTAKCGFEGEFDYYCKWGVRSKVILVLNNPQWVYVDRKRVNYVLNGEVTVDVVGAAKPLSCSLRTKHQAIIPTLLNNDGNSSVVKSEFGTEGGRLLR